MAQHYILHTIDMGIIRAWKTIKNISIEHPLNRYVYRWMYKSLVRRFVQYNSTICGLAVYSTLEYVCFLCVRSCICDDIQTLNNATRCNTHQEQSNRERRKHSATNWKQSGMLMVYAKCVSTVYIGECVANTSTAAICGFVSSHHCSRTHRITAHACIRIRINENENFLIEENLGLDLYTHFIEHCAFVRSLA